MDDGGFDIKDFLNNDDKDDLQKIFGADIFNLLDAPSSAEVEDEEEEERKVPKFKYSDAKKKKMMSDNTVTYVNDYGKSDPYHIDMGDSYVNQVRNEIHAIYGNRTIAQYIIAMRKVLRVYQEMYDSSVSRLILSFPEYIDRIVKGDIKGPVNHPLVRTNVPDDILLRYIMDEKLDPEEVRQFVSIPGEKKDDYENMVFEIGTFEEDANRPVEYEVMPELIQRRMLKSWLTGKLQTKGLDKNERNLVYGLTNQYDQIGIEDASFFVFDTRIREHQDVLSWKNIKRRAVPHIQLKDYTSKDLEEVKRGNFIRAVMHDDKVEGVESPEITFTMLINRIESNAAARGEPVAMKQWGDKYKLYTQGVVGIKVNKYGRETYIYKDKSKVKRNTVNESIKLIEEKAKVFRELTDSVNERFRSAQFSDLMKEIQKEQDIIEKYGITYYTKGE